MKTIGAGDIDIKKAVADVTKKSDDNKGSPDADVANTDDSDSGEDELFGYLTKKAKVKPKVTAKVDLTSDNSVTDNKNNSLKARSSIFTDLLVKNGTKSSVPTSQQSQLYETKIKNIEVAQHISGSKKVNNFTKQKEEEYLTSTNTIGCNTDRDLTEDEQRLDGSLQFVNNKNKCRINDNSRILNVKFPNRKKNNQETKAVSERLSESESEDVYTAQKHDEYSQSLSRFRIRNSQGLNGSESENVERSDIDHVQDSFSNLSDSSPAKLEVSLIELDVSPIPSPKTAVIENKGNKLSHPNFAETNQVFVPNVNKSSYVPTQYKFVRDGNKLARVAVVQQCHVVPNYVEFDGLYDHPVLSEMKVERNWKESDIQLSNLEGVQPAKLLNIKTTETIRGSDGQQPDIEITEKNYEQGLSGDDQLPILSKTGIETTKSSFQNLSCKTDVKSRKSKETVSAGRNDDNNLSQDQDNSMIVSNQANAEATENYVHRGQNDTEYYQNRNDHSLNESTDFIDHSPVQEVALESAHGYQQFKTSSVDVMAINTEENMSDVSVNVTETESTSRSQHNIALDPECNTRGNKNQPIDKAAEITPSPCENEGNIDHDIVKKTDNDFMEYLENTCLSENASTCSRVSLCSSESPIVLKVSADGRLSECTQSPVFVSSEGHILRERKTEMDINFLTMRILKLESDVIEMKKATGDGQIEQNNFVERQTNDVSKMSYFAKKSTDFEIESAEKVNSKTDAVVDTLDSDVQQPSSDNHSYQSIERGDSDTVKSSKKVKQSRKRKKPDSNNDDQVDQPIEKHTKSMSNKGDDTVKALETINKSCLKGKKRWSTKDSEASALARTANVVAASKAKSRQIKKCPKTVDNPETNKLNSHKKYGKNYSSSSQTHDVGVHKGTVLKVLPTSINFGISLCDNTQMETVDFMNYDEDNLEKLYQLKLAEVKTIQNALKQKKKERNSKRKPNKNVSKFKKSKKEANDTRTTETTLGDKIDKTVGEEGKLSCIKDLSRKESWDCVTSTPSSHKNTSEIDKTKKPSPYLNPSRQASVRKKKLLDIKTAKVNLVYIEKDKEIIANKSPKKSKLSSNMVRSSGRKKTSKPKVNKKVTWNKKEVELFGDQQQTICDSKDDADITEISNNVQENTLIDSVVKNNLRKGKTPINRTFKGKSVSNLATDVNKTSNASEVKEATGSKSCEPVNFEKSLFCVKHEVCIEKKGRKRKSSTVCQCCITSNETFVEEKQNTSHPVTDEELEVTCIEDSANENLFEKEISPGSSEKCKNNERKKQRLEALISEKLLIAKSTEMKANIGANKNHEKETKTTMKRGKRSNTFNKRLNKNKFKASKTIKSKEKLRDLKQTKSQLKVDSPLSDMEKKTNSNNSVTMSNTPDLKKRSKKEGKKPKLSKVKMVGSVQAARMAFEKSYDYSWKDKLGTDAFSMNLINQQQGNKKPLDVKKMIKKILVSPESSDIKKVSHRSTKHRRKHVDGKHSMTEVVEIICSDSDDAWLSDSSVSFPGIRLGDTGENTQVNLVNKLHASGQTNLDITRKPSQTEANKVTKLGVTGVEYPQSDSVLPLEKRHSEIVTDKKLTVNQNNLSEVDDSVFEQDLSDAQPSSEAKLNEICVESGIKQGGNAVQFRSETITCVDGNNQVNDENEKFKSVKKSEVESNLINTKKPDTAKNVERKINCIELHSSPSKAEQLEIQTGSNSDSYYTDSDSEHKKVYVTSQKSQVSPKVSSTFTQIKSLLGRRERKIPVNSAIQNLKFISD